MKKWRLAVLALLGTAVLWLPFYLRLSSFWGLDFSQGVMALWKNFDGPNYLIVAKTWYDKALIAGRFSSPLPLEYYPAHWPFYPWVIFLFDLFLPGPWAMLAASVLGLGLFYWVLPKFLIKFGVSKKNVLWLGIVSLILPARWIVLRSIGSAEAWLMSFLMLALAAYKDKKYWLAGLWGALAQLTKSPAILLFASFGLYELIGAVRYQKSYAMALKNWLKTGLIPLMILAVFGFYWRRTGNFWAYLNSGDNFHLFWPPFSIFSKGYVWVGDFWLEEVIWLWLIYGVGTARLWLKNKKLLASFGGVFFTSTLFVSHRDLGRYIIPLLPLLLIAYEKVLVKREFKIILGVLIIPCLLFAWNFMLNNLAPIADWAPYL